MPLLGQAATLLSASLAQTDLGDTHLQKQGATGVVDSRYRIDCSLTDREANA